MTRHGFGITIRKDGRAKIVCRDGTTVYFYRALVEASIGRHLRPEERVHHINGDRSDDRLENLRLYGSHGEHMQEHGRESARIASEGECARCGCPKDERTRGCKACAHRHGRRRRLGRYLPHKTKHEARA